MPNQEISILNKIIVTLIFCICFLEASSQEYKENEDSLKLSEQRYWQLLLHATNNVSEIDDSTFFLATDGKTNPKNELHATLDALFNEERLDDNSTACRFPARKAWLKEQLGIDDFVAVHCDEYDTTLKRLSPKSATLVFPAAHINSPASMFGHTFLRINSAYESRLLSYAINYAADANPDESNAVEFAIKGLFGGYFGRYSLLPYYDKLKEYRDTEQRDIWEYNLNLNEAEVLKMVEHIWELNGTHSYYYFFTENCSYNMLWLLELARPTLHLREYFSYQVIPMETVHAAHLENIIKDTTFRASKRTTLLKYESLIDEEYIHMPKELIHSRLKLEDIVQNRQIALQQKQYILEASIEFLEYAFSRNKMSKEEYLEMFHALSKARAALGSGARLDIQTPPNPLNSHRAIRTTAGFGYQESSEVGFLGIRPAYHDLFDSNYGFLRGTQIEFGDILLSYAQDELKVEKATILSIASIAQRSEFFDSFSWRTKFGWDRDSLDEKTNFMGSVGFGYSWGNEFAYVYCMADPLFYMQNRAVSALGGSLGIVIDTYPFMSTNLEATQRFYDRGETQFLANAVQSFRLSQNTQLRFEYSYLERYVNDKKVKEASSKATLNYYF